MLGTRILAALVFAPTLLAVVVVGGLPLLITTALLTVGMLWEALRLLVPHASRPLLAAAWASGLLTLALNVGVLDHGQSQSVAAACTVALLLAALTSTGDLRAQVAQASGCLMAVAYTAGLWPLLWRLRVRPELGLGLALLALFCTWASDTGAYAAGRALGRRKLYPRISPGKTLEGALGGLACAMLMAWALQRGLGLPLATSQALTLGLVAATLGILGDLSESLLKRQAGVKDSSALIPGHGGLLDRFDGVLFALFGVEAYTTWVLGR